jgi:CRISPR-associated protein Cas1
MTFLLLNGHGIEMHVDDAKLFLKARELAHFLVGKQKSLDLISHDYSISRQDAVDVRKKILRIPYAEWKKRGFSKGTLHYMKKNAGGSSAVHAQ